MREAGQGRNPAALSDFRCVLFFCVEEDLWPILVFLKIKKAFLDTGTQSVDIPGNQFHSILHSFN